MRLPSIIGSQRNVLFISKSNPKRPINPLHNPSASPSMPKHQSFWSFCSSARSKSSNMERESVSTGAPSSSGSPPTQTVPVYSGSPDTSTSRLTTPEEPTPDSQAVRNPQVKVQSASSSESQPSQTSSAPDTSCCLSTEEFGYLSTYL